MSQTVITSEPRRADKVRTEETGRVFKDTVHLMWQR